jgi:hypothetical protein
MKIINSLIFFLTITAHGEQISFSSRLIGDAVGFEYIWRGPDKRQIKTEFTISKEEIDRGDMEFEGFKKKEVEGKLLDAMRAEGQKIGGLLDVSIVITKTKEGFNIAAKGPAEKINKACEYLNAREPLIEAELLKDRYLKGAKNGNVTLVTPDYKAIANRYADAMSCVAKSLTKPASSTQREAITHYLDFIRTIPYSTEFANDAQYQTPIGMLIENRGDCDTKAIAFAALMKNFNINVIFLVLPNHMLVGIAIPAEPGDITIVDEGVTYVLAENSGPELPPLGEVGIQTLDIIRDGNYSTIKM